MSSKPWFGVRQNDHGETWYVNGYWTDDQGTTRRVTIADALPLAFAQQLLQALNLCSDKMLLFGWNGEQKCS